MTEVPTYAEALAMLGDKAREGSVTAIVALERALRMRSADEAEDVGDAIDRILAEKDQGTVAESASGGQRPLGGSPWEKLRFAAVSRSARGPFARFASETARARDRRRHRACRSHPEAC
jgi:hypothetical protein